MFSALFRNRYVRNWLHYKTYRLRRHLRSNALDKGLLGGQILWMSVFAISLLLRGLRVLLKRGPMPVRFSETLEPGASYLITHIVPPTRRQQRRARRAAAA